MHETKEYAGHDNAGQQAEPLSEEWKQIATKNGFFNERRDEDGHSHKSESHSAILEDVLNWGVLGRFGESGDKHDDNGESATEGQIQPGLRRSFGILRIQFSPAE